MYAAFIALTASGIFVVMPRILIEILPFWFGQLISSISNILIISCNLTTCIMTIGIVAALSRDDNITYLVCTPALYIQYYYSVIPTIIIVNYTVCGTFISVSRFRGYMLVLCYSSSNGTNYSKSWTAFILVSK